MRSFRRGLVLWSLGHLLLLAPLLARGAEVVDQTNLIPFSTTPAFNNIYSAQTRAQTFTVARPGRVTKVEVQIYRQATTSANLTLELRRVTPSGQPTGELLAQAFVFPYQLSFSSPLPNPPPALVWDLSAQPIEAHAGDRLAIVASSSATATSNAYRWLTRTADLFAGGTAMVRTTPTGSFTNVSGDQGFRSSVEQSITFGFQGVVTSAPPGDPDFAAGDLIVGQYTYSAETPGYVPINPAYDWGFVATGQWHFSLPTRGHYGRGTLMLMTTANNNPNGVPLHDVYGVALDDVTASSSFSGGRTLDQLNLDLFDQSGPDLLSSSLLPFSPPDPLSADQHVGQIYLSPASYISFQVTSMSYQPAGFDVDADGSADPGDNCPVLWNADQLDQDLDGTGDACEDSDGDGVSDSDEGRFFGTSPLAADSDDDGTTDAADLGTAQWCETVIECAATDPNDEYCSTFGQSVAISGDTIVVGIPYYNPFPGDYSYYQAGGAFLFQRSGGTWTKTRDRLYPDGSNLSYRMIGASSAIFDDTIVLGGDISPYGATGTYVFRKFGTDWGNSVSFSVYNSDSVAVGADLLAIGDASDSFFGTQAGYVSIFSKVDDFWGTYPVATPFPPSPQPYDHFGRRVAVMGSHVAVAAPGRDATGPESGDIFVYEVPPGALGEVSVPIVTDPAPWDSLAQALAGESSLLLAGTPFANGYLGQVKTFQRVNVPGAPWISAGSLAIPPSFGAHGGLGAAVGLGRRTAVFSAPYGDPGRLFMARPRIANGRSTGEWNVAELISGLTDVYAGNATVVAADGETVVVGGRQHLVSGRLQGVVSVFEPKFATDPDCDGDLAGSDNCPSIANPTQSDVDQDGVGDACEEDADADGVLNPADSCPLVPNSGPAQVDSDVDGIGDVCDACPTSTLNDADLDGICDDVDNCPGLANPDQANSDPDPSGNACDPDSDWDNDGVANAVDNCPIDPNPDQLDVEPDQVGEVCDLNTDIPPVTADGQQSVADDPPEYRWRFDPSSIFTSSDLDLAPSTTAAGQCYALDISETQIEIDFYNYTSPGFSCCAWEMRCLDQPPCICDNSGPDRCRVFGDHAIGSKSFSYGTAVAELPVYRPSDPDTLPDQCDNCDYVDNEDQADADQNGRGNACECGDVDENGRRQANDVLTFRLALTKATTFSAARAAKCNVFGGTNPNDADLNGLRDDCNIIDVAVLQRALSGKGPGVAQVCVSAGQN